MRGNTEAVNELPADGDRESQWPKLAVKDFGPIAEGEVELRPLTVFAGLSNTGKSWMATLVYTIMRHVNGDCGEFSDFGPRLWFGQTDADRNELKNFPENPTAWLQSIREGGMLRLTNSEKQTLKSILESGQGALQEELLRCFGLTETRHLVREGSAGATSVTFMSAAASDCFTTRQRLAITGEGGVSLNVDVMTDECRPRDMENPSAAIFGLLLDTVLDDESGRSPSLYSRAGLLGSLVNNYRYSSIYYLPADRGGVMHTHRAMVGALIQGASRAGPTHRSPQPALSGVFGDFLEQLVGLTNHESEGRPPENPTSGPAGSLEQKILRGQIRVERSQIDYPHFTYRPDGWKRDLSFKSVSSMVSELAPVALYLRYCVKENNLLILEKPEAHLHPAMQVKLVREIAKWVKAGIRVLITTHSEWMLEEISNLVAAGEVGKKDGLQKQEVGMWLFESQGDQVPGSRIREIEWSIDEGGFALDFDDVAMKLHNTWADLMRDIE